MPETLKQQITTKDSETNPRIEHEIALTMLVSIVWKKKILVIFITLLFSLASIFYAVNEPNIYKSEALLTPVEAESASGLSALAGQFGGLASLAGVNLGGGSNKSQLAVEVIKSRKFTSAFISKHNILKELMAAKNWEPSSNKLIYDDDIYNEQSGEWVRNVSFPLNKKPSLQEAYKTFEDVVSVKTDKETGLVTISIVHVSPFIAQQWVNWLVEDINQEMKDRDVVEANRSTEFLTKQLEVTNIADIRSVLYKLIEEQAKTIMFANVRDEYVFNTIDPALAPEQKDGPKRALIVIIFTLLGGVIGSLIVIFNYYRKTEKNN